MLKKLTSYKVLGSLLSLCMLFAISLTTAVFAADVYPSKTVRLIVPWPAGLIGDTVGRMVASKLSERLGKAVIVENRPGATGVIGMEVTAKADPDGYTMVQVQDAHTLLPASQKMSYDLIKDFTPIAKKGHAWYLLLANSSFPANSLKEFIALAKQKPGQLIWAGPGSRGVMHLSAEFLKMNTGIDFKIVQFKGAAPAITDVLGGHSHVTMSSISSSMPHLQSGKLKALAICAPKRSVLLPDVPTTPEQGAPWFQAGVFWGIVVRAGTPPSIVERLSNEFKAVLAMDEVKKFFLSRGAEVDYQGPTEFGIFLKEQMAKWADIVKRANIKWE